MTSCDLKTWIVVIEGIALIGVTCWAMVLDTRLEQRNNYIRRMYNDSAWLGTWYCPKCSAEDSHE